MAIQIQGSSGTTAEVDGTTFRAIRVTLRPTDYGSLGEYSISGLSGTVAAGLAASSELFQARWTDATRFALIKAVSCDGVSGSATAFAAGFGKIDCILSRSWSADGTGGTALTITGNNAKLRTAMGTTLFGTLRIATTAALGAGTKTLDSNAIGQISLSIGTTTSVQYISRMQLFGDFNNNTSHPVVLATNEGLSCRATVPATGTWQTGFSLEWAEVSAY